MNLLIPDTTSTPFIIPLNQLTNYCNRLISSIKNAETDQKNRTLHEQTLWSEVKKIKSTSDNSVFLHLTGFYLTVLFQISQLNDKDDHLHYNVLIRLGDLSRYMGNKDVAEYYYCSARNLYPCYGHAYNQLGLLTKPKNYFKCCYYYARAAKASDKPLVTIADSNIKMAVKKYGSKLLKSVIFLEFENGSQSSSNNDIDLPTSSFEWFYVTVLAIYADNVAPVANSFLDYLEENFCTQSSTIVTEKSKQTNISCSLESYLLLASLDILLDWLRYGSQAKELQGKLSSQLRQIKLSLQKVVVSCELANQSSQAKKISQRNQALSQSTIYGTNPSYDGRCDDRNVIHTTTILSDHSTLNDSSLNDATSFESSMTSNNSKINYKALPHDYVLSGFEPLDLVHKNVIFKWRNDRTKGMLEQHLMNWTSPDTKDETFLDSAQLVQIVNRLQSKINKISPIEKKKLRGKRNIALQSILCKLEQEEENRL